MRRSAWLVAVLLVASSCDVLFPDVPEPNLSGVGPAATEAAVEINYPRDLAPLPVSYFDLARAWNGLIQDMDVLPSLPTDAVEGVVTASNDLSGVVFDLDTANGQVNVAQLFIQKGSRDSDLVVVDRAIEAFIKTVSGEDGPLDATLASLGMGENRFVLTEGEAVLGEVRLWFAANEDALLLGAIGEP